MQYFLSVRNLESPTEHKSESLRNTFNYMILKLGQTLWVSIGYHRFKIYSNRYLCDPPFVHRSN